MSRPCSICASPDAQHMCGQCLNASFLYCSRECQAVHWTSGNHKLSCRAIGDTPTVVSRRPVSRVQPEVKQQTAAASDLDTLLKAIDDIVSKTNAPATPTLDEASAIQYVIENNLTQRLLGLGHSQKTVQYVIETCKSDAETFVVPMTTGKGIVTFGDYLQLRDANEQSFTKLLNVLNVPQATRIEFREYEQDRLAEMAAIQLIGCAEHWTENIDGYVENGTEQATIDEILSASFPFPPEYVGYGGNGEPSSNTSTLSQCWKGFRMILSNALIPLKLPGQLLRKMTQLIPFSTAAESNITITTHSSGWQLVRTMLTISVALTTTFLVARVGGTYNVNETNWLATRVANIIGSNVQTIGYSILQLRNILKVFIPSNPVLSLTDAGIPQDAVESIQNIVDLHALDALISPATALEMTQYAGETLKQYCVALIHFRLELLLIMMTGVAGGIAINAALNAYRGRVYRRAKGNSPNVRIPIHSELALQQRDPQNNTDLNQAITIARAMDVVEVMTVIPIVSFVLGYSTIATHVVFIEQVEMLRVAISGLLIHIYPRWLDTIVITNIMRLVGSALITLPMCGVAFRYSSPKIAGIVSSVIFTAVFKYLCSIVDEVALGSHPAVIITISLLVSYSAVSMFTRDVSQPGISILQPSSFFQRIDLLASRFKESLIPLLPPLSLDKSEWHKFRGKLELLLSPPVSGAWNSAANIKWVSRFAIYANAIIHLFSNTLEFDTLKWIALAVGVYAAGAWVNRRYSGGNFDRLLTDVRLLYAPDAAAATVNQVFEAVGSYVPIDGPSSRSPQSRSRSRKKYSVNL